MTAPGGPLVRLRDARPALTEADGRAADYLIAHAAASGLLIAALATEAGVNEATVVRLGRARCA